MQSLITVFVILSVGVTTATEVVTFEQDQGYPAVGSSNESIIGVDGWSATTSSNTAFIVDAGRARPATAGVPSQVAMINQNAWYYRIFAGTNDLRKGVVSFILYAGNAGNKVTCFRLYLTDYISSTTDLTCLQLRFAKDDIVNASGYFELRNTVGVVATSPDVAGITHSTWYKVVIAYDLDDHTSGANGTYNLTITNLSLANPAVVWSYTGAVVEAVGEVDRFVLAGVTVGSTRTFLDDITFMPPPPKTCQEVWNRGFGLASDLNGDCYVNFLDFAIIASRWLTY